MIAINDRVLILAGDAVDQIAVVYAVGDVSVGLRAARWYFVRLVGGQEGAYTDEELRVVE